MAESGRNKDFLHVPDNFVLLPLTDLAGLAVHESGPQLVAAPLADCFFEGNIMRVGGVIETLDVDVLKLPVLMLAELSIGQVLLDGIVADDAGLLVLVRILDDVGALVADLAELADAVGQLGSVAAGELHLVGETLVEIVAAQRTVLVALFTHTN